MLGGVIVVPEGLLSSPVSGGTRFDCFCGVLVNTSSLAGISFNGDMGEVGLELCGAMSTVALLLL